MTAVQDWLEHALTQVPDEPQAVQAQRRSAAQTLRSRGLPTRHDEDWKYTSLKGLDVLPRADSVSPARVSADDLNALGAIDHPDCARVVFVDGRYAPGLSRLHGLPQGARLRCWSARLTPDLAHEVLAAAADADAVDAVNRLFAADGLDLELAAGVRIAQPLLVVTLQTNAGGSHLRHRITLGAGARIQLVEQHLALAATPGYVVTESTRMDLGVHAALHHVRLQTEAETASHVSQLHVVQAERSQFDAQLLALGAALSRQEWHVDQRAAGCSAEVRAASLLHGQQHGDVHLRIAHRQPHGHSRTHVRGVFDDAARGVFTGRVDVLPGADKTDAAMINRNVLLSMAAEVDTRPQLQIDADDVQCSHGAAVGRLDDDALFYLTARGIAADEARALLLRAFIVPALPDIGWAPLTRQIAALLAARGMPTPDVTEPR